MQETTGGGGSSPLSSVPESETLSQPSLSQPTQQKAPDEAEIGPAFQAAGVQMPDAVPETVTMASSRPKRTRAGRLPTPKEESPKKVAKKVPKRTPKKKQWDVEDLLTDPKSPLATADLRSLLSNPMAWDALDWDDRAEILALLPEGTPTLQLSEDEQRRPDINALRNDDTFRHDCATYIGHLADGHFERDWLESAWVASQLRKMGEFDDYLIRKFEEDWAEEVPEDMKPRREVKMDEVTGGPVEGGKPRDDAAMEQDAVDDGHEMKSDADKTGPEAAQPLEAVQTDKSANMEELNAPRTPTKSEKESKLSSEMDNASISDLAGRSHGDGDKMVIDELQNDTTPKKKQRTPLVQRPNHKMEVGGEESADELA